MKKFEFLFIFLIITVNVKLYQSSQKNKSKFRKTHSHVKANKKNIVYKKDNENMNKSIELLPDGINKKLTTTTKIGNSVIKQETVEYEIGNSKNDMNSNFNIDNTHYYKEQLNLGATTELISIDEISRNCESVGCDLCRKSSPSVCKFCTRGYFLYNSSCYLECPINYTFDVFKRRCNPTTSKSALAQMTYHKAFTVGSCDNMCGNVTTDCSCESTCISQGSCCSDYHTCEELIRINTARRDECTVLSSNCELCRNFDVLPNGSVSCGKCSKRFFNREGVCVPVCNSSDNLNPKNKICIAPKQVCHLQNCAECDNANPYVCQNCEKGYFMYNNQCLTYCPMRLRADRIAWVCLEPPVFAWYWIFPSKKSCRNNCGKSFVTTYGCSCTQDCFRYGNCCEDIEDFCREFIYWK